MPMPWSFDPLAWAALLGYGLSLCGTFRGDWWGAGIALILGHIAAGLRVRPPREPRVTR